MGSHHVGSNLWLSCFGSMVYGFSSCGLKPLAILFRIYGVRVPIMWAQTFGYLVSDLWSTGSHHGGSNLWLSCFGSMVYGFSSCGLKLLVILFPIYGLRVLIMWNQTFGYPVSDIWSTGSHHVGFWLSCFGSMVCGFSSCGLKPLVILFRIYGLRVLIMWAPTFGYPVSDLWSMGSHHGGSNFWLSCFGSMVYGISSCGLKPLVILFRIYGLRVLIMWAQTFGYPVSDLWSTGSHHVGSNLWLSCFGSMVYGFSSWELKPLVILFRIYGLENP
jgi:uncharacterized membrane protein YqjE